ncbi:MAG: hypothetical protein NVSMB56_16150 [Pyrinomonadaceae bacterium]
MRSFFNLRNHPLTEIERAGIATRDFLPEMQIMHQTLVQGLYLAHELMQRRSPPFAIDNDGFDVENLNGFSVDDFSSGENLNAAHTVALVDMLNDAVIVCENLLSTPVNCNSWTSFGRMIERELDGAEKSAIASIASSTYVNLRCAQHLSPCKRIVQTELLELTKKIEPPTLGADMLVIFAELKSLLDLLQLIESLLKSDAPLKQTLPLFALAQQDSRSLIYFIEARALCVEGLDAKIFDALDGTAYAIGMELNKVFVHELAGVSALRHAPGIYAKIENAHGLLRDCFQQSTATLAHAFRESTNLTHLFNVFESKLQQSLSLRRDLWTLLCSVRRAEEARDRQPVAPLLEKLDEFQTGSLRHLMYKDWEAYERFVEEIIAARGATELMPVLHRFSTYLETLFGQINMRAVLANHPFDVQS